MKVGKFVLNSDVVEEVISDELYETWAEAFVVARALQNDTIDDDTVVDIFVAAETSPTTYVIKSILD
tara:strand:+ start:4834 stop:5034 length:201 start_codon:yes stop_codon:yes gene_type:complete